MFLVQITITDIDADEIVKSESRNCEHYSVTDSSDGFTLECGEKRRGARRNGDGPDWGTVMATGLKLWNGLKAADQRAQDSADADGREQKPKSGCCGQ